MPAEVQDINVENENFYAIRLQSAADNAGALSIRHAVQLAELLGYEELESEEWMKFEIDMLDTALALMLNEQNSEIVFDYPTEKIWNPEGISLQKRIEQDPSLAKRIDQVLEPTNFSQFIVPVDMKAPARCIDGRHIKGWAKSEALQKRGLGPKIAGATAHAALAHRIVDSDSIKEAVKKGRTFDDDILSVIEIYIEAGLGFGIHIDDHQHGNNTGCGAIDNINFILDRTQMPEPQQQIRGLTKAIMGDAFDRHITNDVMGRMLFLDSVKPRYMPKEGDQPDGEFIYKKTIVETVRKATSEHHEPIEQLEGKHNEVALILNFVEGTTIDTDRLSNDTNGEIQVFGWDVWEIFNEAERLFPLSSTASLETQQKAIQNRIKHVTVRTILGIATAMVLTDGSLRVGMLKPTLK